MQRQTCNKNSPVPEEQNPSAALMIASWQMQLWSPGYHKDVQTLMSNCLVQFVRLAPLIPKEPPEQGLPRLQCMSANHRTPSSETKLVSSESQVWTETSEHSLGDALNALAPTSHQFLPFLPSQMHLLHLKTKGLQAAPAKEWGFARATHCKRM